MPAVALRCWRCLWLSDRTARCAFMGPLSQYLDEMLRFQCPQELPIDFKDVATLWVTDKLRQHSFSVEVTAPQCCSCR